MGCDFMAVVMISADNKCPCGYDLHFFLNKTNLFCLTKVIIINISLAVILCVNSWSETKK